MTKVQLYVNGELQNELTNGPYAFNAPDDLSGEVILEARGYDNRNSVTSTFITVNMADTCESESDCESDQICLRGFCAKGQNIEGGLGALCTSSTECDSRTCTQVEENSICSVSCSDEENPCPSGFNCVDNAEGQFCASENPITISGPETAEGGCNSRNKTSHWLFSFFLFALLGWKVRRQRA